MNNDYRHLLAVDPACGDEPVSVVMTTFNRRDAVARTLAGLVHSDYRRDRVEVVVVDDGSHDDTFEVVRQFDDALNIVFIRQADRGFRVATACNYGIAAASHECVILLSGDMIPCRALISTYMRLLPQLGNVVLIGDRRFVDVSGIDYRQIWADPHFETHLVPVRTANDMWSGEQTTKDWRSRLYERTDWLLEEKWPFRAFVGSNVAFRKSMAQRIGMFCDEYTAWGCEDDDFGFRAYLDGCYFIPMPSAVAYHQEPPGGVNETPRRAGYETTRVILAERCPTPIYRRKDGRYRIPKVSICIHGDNIRRLHERGVAVTNGSECEDVEAVLVYCGAPSETALPTGSRIRWVKLPWGRGGSVLNAGAAEAKGAYLTHWQQGCDPGLAVIARLTMRLDRENVGCVVEDWCGSTHTPGEPLGKSAWLYRKREWNRLGGFPSALDCNSPEMCIRELSSVSSVAR